MGKLGHVEVGIDWLSLNVPADRLEDLRSLVGQACGKCSGEGRAKLFSHREDYGDGVAIMFDSYVVPSCGPHEETGYKNGRVYLEVKGSGCSRLGVDGVCDLVGRIQSLGEVRCTRMDVAVDVRESEWLTVGQVRERAGDAEPFRKWRAFEENGTVTGVQFGERGRFGSGTMVVIYDKGFAEGSGARWVRVEVRFFAADGRAQRAFDEVFPVRWHGEGFESGAVVERAGAIASGAISFAEWKEWSRFAKGLGNVRIGPSARLPRGVLEARAWLLRCAARSLALVEREDLRRGVDPQLFREQLLSEGRQKLGTGVDVEEAPF